jgi:hypothetical protein
LAKIIKLNYDQNDFIELFPKWFHWIVTKIILSNFCQNDFIELLPKWFYRIVAKMILSNCCQNDFIELWPRLFLFERRFFDDKVSGQTHDETFFRWKNTNTKKSKAKPKFFCISQKHFCFSREWSFMCIRKFFLIHAMFYLKRKVLTV